MGIKVHILATCRKPELALFTELVFKTLRVGFPTAEITVHLNRNAVSNCPRLPKLCEKSKARCVNEDTIHHEWIDVLIGTEAEPFWIVDTDIIFYDSFEVLDLRGEWLAGCRVPEWQDEFSGSLTRSRLHSSLLYINPSLVKEKLAAFKTVLPTDSPFTPFYNPVYPVCLPMNGKMYFHDTMSLMYHAIGGRAFTDAERDRYFHLNFGTIPDLVLPRLKDGGEMSAARRRVIENPELGRGAWRFQDEYFSNRQAVTGSVELPPIKPEDAKSATEWNIRICNGDKEAMAFNDLWYRYVHGIDDLIDTSVDGRPRMSPEQIIHLFFDAALLYNSDFFIKHRNLLFPVVLLVTNTYTNSVLWEKSPL